MKARLGEHAFAEVLTAEERESLSSKAEAALLWLDENDTPSLAELQHQLKVRYSLSLSITLNSREKWHVYRSWKSCTVQWSRLPRRDCKRRKRPSPLLTLPVNTWRPSKGTRLRGTAAPTPGSPLSLLRPNSFLTTKDLTDLACSNCCFTFVEYIAIYPSNALPSSPSPSSDRATLVVTMCEACIDFEQ